MRKTGNLIIATYDSSGDFPEQSLYFLFNNRSGADEKFTLGLLNSRFLNTFFSAKCLANKDSIAQVKKVDLDCLPIVIPNKREKNGRRIHDKLVSLVEKMLTLAPKLRSETSPSRRSVLENAKCAADQEIDHLVYELYDLTLEEIALVEEAFAAKC